MIELVGWGDREMILLLGKNFVLLAEKHSLQQLFFSSSSMDLQELVILYKSCPWDLVLHALCYPDGKMQSARLVSQGSIFPPWKEDSSLPEPGIWWIQSDLVFFFEVRVAGRIHFPWFQFMVSWEAFPTDIFNSSGKLHRSCRKPGSLLLGDPGCLSAMSAAMVFLESRVS